MAAISVSKKRQLVAVLSDIPLVTWNTIVKKEPEWERMEPLARRWHFGPFVVLMVATGLNDYQLEGKAEVVYWPKLRDLFDRYPSPGSIKDIDNALKPFYQAKRLGDQKVARLDRFLGSPLARRLWQASLKEISQQFRKIWNDLALTMNQEPGAKTICFAMKCLGICLLMFEEYGFDFSEIPIPVDFRVIEFTKAAGLVGQEIHSEIRTVWSEVLSELNFRNPDISMIHLDSLVWQIARLNDGQLKKYFTDLNLQKVGGALQNLLNR